MKATLKQLLLVAMLCMASAVAAAQSDSAVAVVERPVLSVYSLELGSSHLADTYLTPLRYKGTSLGLDYERTQAMRFNPERWVMRLHGSLRGESAQNPVRNANIYAIDLTLGWAMMHRWNAGRFTLAAGGSTDVNGGVFYAPRNSNNPASAKGSWTINATGYAAYSGKIGKIPFCARELAELPLTGIFFSPEYDELYYEIYLGNRSGLVHYAHPGNFFRFDNTASIDLRFGRTILRVGYRCRILSTKVSDIVTRNISHSAIIGIASEWLALGTDRKAANEARIISSLY